MLGEPGVGEQAVLDQHGEQRGEQVGVAAGHRAGGGCRRGRRSRCGAGSTTIERALGIVGDRLEVAPGLREAVRLPRVLAPEHGDLGVLVVAGRVAAGPAEQLAVDPELARLLLGQGVGAVADAERVARRRAVAAAEVVALAAAAVEEDRRAAVGVDDVTEAGGDLGDGRVPVDRLERAVGPPAQRRGQAVRTVLVVVEAQGLLARVALGGRVGLVAADPSDRRPVDARPRCRS